MPQETVLIRIVTAANMAGVKEARAGFLGMNPAILAAGIALAIIVKIGKDSIENIKAQETALKSLEQAYATQSDILGAHRAELDAFIATNQRYITNQYDVITALASVVRAGNNETDSMRILNDALDLAVIKHEDVSVAAITVIKVLNGNSRALRELGISTAVYNQIQKSHLTTRQKHLALLKLIEGKTKDGRKATDDLKQSQNNLTTEYQNFTTKAGPEVTLALGHINDALASGVGILSIYWELADKLWKVGLQHLGVTTTPAGGTGKLIGSRGGTTHQAPPLGGGSTLVIHGNVTLVHQDEHAKELAKLHRKNDRAKS